MTYGYNVVDGKVFVTPVVYACQQCPFTTTDKEAEQKHYYGYVHYLKSTLPRELREEWDEEKHGALPSWVKGKFNCNHCQFSNEDDLCDKRHTERQPGRADFAPMCPDLRLLHQRSIGV